MLNNEKNSYIINKKFNYTAKPTHKVKVLKTKIYKSNNFLPFSSEIEVLKREKNYFLSVLFLMQ